MVLFVKPLRELGLTRRALAAKAEFVLGEAILLITTIFMCVQDPRNAYARAPDCLCVVAWTYADGVGPTTKGSFELRLIAFRRGVHAQRRRARSRPACSGVGHSDA